MNTRHSIHKISERFQLNRWFLFFKE